MTSIPASLNRWALQPTPLPEVDDDYEDSMSLLGNGSEWDDDWFPDEPDKPSATQDQPLALSMGSTATFLSSISSRTPSSSASTTAVRTPPTPNKALTALSPLLEEYSYAGKVSSSKTPAQSAKISTTTTRRTEAKALQHLLALFNRGVTHIPAHEIRTQAKKSILNGAYIESILYGDRPVLNAGEAALGAGGGRPASATRAIAACPVRYGAPDSLPAAMALAHAHCAMHDVFVCDARLAPAEDYYDILCGFVTALTDWPAVATRTDEPLDSDILKILDLPPFEQGGGFSLGLRSEAFEVPLDSSGKHGICGPALVPKMTEKNITWFSSQQTLLDGWFPWLFVEPLGRCDDVSQGYIRLLSTMRTSLAMYSRLYSQAVEVQPAWCTPRMEGTRIVYGLQTIGAIWHVFAMAEDDGQFPVATIWSGRVEEPRHMTQATAILRQIGAEAKLRLRSIRDWLTCILVEHKGLVTSAPVLPGVAHLNLPSGVPTTGVTQATDAPILITPPCLDPHPNTQSPPGNRSPEPSWKPWVEPFQSSRSSSLSTSSSACPPESTSPSRPVGQILAPTPTPTSRPLPLSIETWRSLSAPYQFGRPPPPPFNYTAAYEYSWPLPSESAAARGGGLGTAYSSWTSPRHIPTTAIVPMKRAASGPVPEGQARAFRPIVLYESTSSSRDSSPPPRVDRIPTPTTSLLSGMAC
ncbi:hypothetical protein CspeluHIS016_0300410 [Cutaneotrichosporon spelunceum]|uniref:Uncharacterized protein n=1 Tax=Cutaneotrichosporon spelunceum TaxID=1672016 RepID=A0AAD3TSM1_9TREE|nr:hypothetical protein CspeluHIS016_0300410 [Cutaneotrichosporon spelunceum]